MSPIALGPFELIRPAARGGMGVVWQGRHRLRDLPVAVKVLTHQAMAAPGHAELFKNEVRAVAGLDHPHIVTLFDYGTVTPVAARTSEGRLAPGCPYLVMEWASRGTLAQRASVKTWRELFTILRQLLDALAHAHARGVIHRDLKPGNVLVCGPDDPRPGLKLADFGIAALAEPDDLVVGTASYMAPEQASASWAELGPWTDLYALGCLAFALVTGAPPFRAKSPLEVLSRTSPTLPALPREIELPPGFDRWLTRLTHPSPGQRYRAAADAAFALDEIDGAAGRFGVLPAGGELEPHDTEVLEADALPTLLWHREPISSSAHAAELPTAEPETLGRFEPPLSSSLPMKPPLPAPRGLVRAVRAPLPERIPETGSAPSGVRALGAGLALWGLRRCPLVGRLRERQALWASLHEVDSKSSPRAMLLRGEAGSGKTRLAEWLAERAHELGAANVLKAVHSPAGGASDGLGPMLARHLRLIGLGAEEARARLRHALAGFGLDTEEDARAFAEITSLSEPSPNARTPSERHAVLTRLVLALSAERPVIVWLDDLQWGPDSLSWAKSALDSEAWEKAAILLLITVREPARVELASERASELEVAVLDREESIALVQELVQVERDVAESVEARVAGNPLFAVQLVGDWIQRGLLEPTESGLRLRSAARLDLPDDIHAFWTERVDRLLSDRPEGEARALEIAAMLGRDVFHDEWLEACALGSAGPGSSLLERLFAEGLAIAGEAGAAVAWSFVHGMLVESLIKRARETGQYAYAHRACARMLERRSGAPERLVHHLMEGGELESAVELAEAAEQRRIEQGDYARAERLLLLHDRALEQLGVGPHDLRVARREVAVADLAFRNGDYARGEAASELAERVARARGDESLLSRALCARGRIAGARGRFAQAMSLLSVGEELARARAETRTLADIERAMARASIDSGDQTGAEHRYLRAKDYSVAICDANGAGISCLGLSEVAKQRGDIEGALAWLEPAGQHFEQAGSRWGLANVAMAMGEIHRLRSELDQAETSYREAARLFEAIGAGQAIFGTINLGLVALARRDYAGARALIERGLEVMRRRKRRSFEGALLLVLALCAEGQRRDADADVLLGDARSILTETRFVDVDTALVAIELGDLAATHGRSAHARQAYELAIAQLEKLGRVEQARGVEQRRALLRDP